MSSAWGCLAFSLWAAGAAGLLAAGSAHEERQDARAAAVRAEDRVSASAGEIRKGNQIIERLQAELRSAKAKAKLKAAVIAEHDAHTAGQRLR